MRENIRHQYRIIAAGAGWIDRAGRGVLRVDGPDRLTFLHALVTNDVMTIRPGHGVSAAYLTPQGRMIADLEILNRGEQVLVLVAHGAAATLAARLDALIFAEQVSVADASADWDEVVVTGARAAAAIGEALGVDPAGLAGLAEHEQTDLTRGFVFRGGESPLPEFTIMVPRAERDRAIERLTAVGAIPIGEELATALRIESGRPAWGMDLFEDTIPLEAGLLDRAISTAKGCYVGQEVIIRILHRGGGRVARRLVQIVLPPSVDRAPDAGTPLVHGADVVGRVTSAAYSPVRDAVIALGYVHRDAAEVGRAIGVGTNGTIGEVAGFAR
jgi:folate-binding protein YgfZ